MKAVFRSEEPDSIEFTLTITMSLGEWKNLREQMNVLYPSWKLREIISSMVHQANEKFFEEKKDV